MQQVVIVNNYQEIVEETPKIIESFTFTPLEWLIKVRANPEQETIILLALKKDIRKIRSDAKIERFRLIEEAHQKQMEMSVSKKVKQEIREETQVQQEIEIKSVTKEQPPSIKQEIQKPVPQEHLRTVTPPLIEKVAVEEPKQKIEQEIILEIKKSTPPPTPPQISQSNVIKKQTEIYIAPDVPIKAVTVEKFAENQPEPQQPVIIEQPANNSIKKSLTSKESNYKGKKENTLSSISKPATLKEIQSLLKPSMNDFGSTEDRQLCEMSIDDESIQYDENNLLDNKTFREHLEKTSKLIDMIRENSPPPLIPEVTHDQHKKSFHDSLYDRSNTQLNTKLQPNQKMKLDIQASSARRDNKTPVDKSKSPAFQKIIKKPNYANAASNAPAKAQEAKLSISPPQSQTRKNVSLSPAQKNKQKVNVGNKSIKERSIENSPKRGSENKKSTQKLDLTKSISLSPKINVKPVKVVQKPKQTAVKIEKPVNVAAAAPVIIKQKIENVQKTSPKKEQPQKGIKQNPELTARTSSVPQSVRSISVTQTANSARGSSIIKIAPIKLPVSKPSITPSLDASATPKYNPAERLGSKRSPKIVGVTNNINTDYQDFVKSASITLRGGDSPQVSKTKQTKIKIIKKSSPERSLDSGSPRRTTQVPNSKRFESEWFSSIMQQEFQKESSHVQKIDQIKQYLQDTRIVNQGLKRKSPKVTPRKNQSLEHIHNDSIVFPNDHLTQESVAGRTLETDFYEDTERPSAAVQSRQQKEGLDVKYNPADKYRHFKKQKTVQQTSKQNRILTIQEPAVESKSINLSKVNQQDGPPQDDNKRFSFNRSGTKQIKDGQNNDKNDIFKQLSPSSRAQSSPKALRQLNPLNQVFMPGDQLQVPLIKLPDFKKKFTIGNATTAVNTNNNQASQDTFKSSLMKTDAFHQAPKDEIIVMNVDIESNREQGLNPLSQISMRPHTKTMISPGGDIRIKKRLGHKLEPIKNTTGRPEIFGNMKNHDQVVTIGAKDGLTYPDISLNFSDANNNSMSEEHTRRFGQVTPFHQYISGAGSTAYPRASSNLSKTGQRIASYHNKLIEHDTQRDNLNQTYFQSIQENGDLGKPKQMRRRQFGKGVSQTKNESPQLSMFFQDSIRGGSMIENFHSTVKRDTSPMTATGHSKFVYPIISSGSQGATKTNNGLVLPSATERKNASTLREAKTANKYFQTSQLMKKNQRSPSPNSAQQNPQQQYFQNYDISVVNCYFLKAPPTSGSLD